MPDSRHNFKRKYRNSKRHRAGVAGSSSPLVVKGASLRAMLSRVLKLVHPPLEEKKHETCGGPVAKAAPPMQGAQVPSLVREPDPTCCN